MSAISARRCDKSFWGYRKSVVARRPACLMMDKDLIEEQKLTLAALLPFSRVWNELYPVSAQHNTEDFSCVFLSPGAQLLLVAEFSFPWAHFVPLESLRWQRVADIVSLKCSSPVIQNQVRSCRLCHTWHPWRIELPAFHFPQLNDNIMHTVIMICT